MNSMTWLEELLVTFALQVVKGLIKNPTHAAAVKEQMLSIADDIYTAYGITPPPHE